MRRCCAWLVLAFVLGVPSAGRLGAERPDDMPVFRLGVSLVQLDAVVTDRHGRQVTTLGPDDFEVLQDGRRQPVTAVAYIRADEQVFDEQGAPIVTTPRRPRDARRVIALIVDDSRMSFGSIYRTRRALAKMINEQLLPEDLVSIVTTSGMRGTVWPFTFSRPELRAAANRLRFSLRSAAVDELDSLGLHGAFGLMPSVEDEFRETVFAVSALNRVADVIDAVRELPGRKTVVLVSEGFGIWGYGTDNGAVRDAMKVLVDRANRAAVVIYAVDPRGLMVTSATAADGPSAGGAELESQRSAALSASQGGLQFVTAQTGGFAVVNNNDMPGAFRRVMDDQRGYYLVGYQPDGSTFGPGSERLFRRLKIKVTRRGLKVRARAGFYGIPTE